MIKIKVILIAMIILLTQSVIVPINSQALSLSDRAYNEGKSVGQLYGRIAGETDYINGDTSNWRKALDDEEENIIEQYNLDEESRSYRLYFLNGFEDEFELAYEDGYRKDNTDINKNSYYVGVNHGQNFGSMDGEIYGKKDYYDGKDNDWKSQIPSELYIIKKYALNNDSDRYKKGFLYGYKSSFEKSYVNAYREVNVESNMASRENAVIHGTEIGFELGSMLGEIDFIDNKTNDWQRAMPSNYEIINEHDLHKEDEEYGDGFLSGFKDGFRDGYIESFQNKNISTGKENINYQSISNKGGILASSDDIVEFIVEPGTIYDQKYMSIKKQDFPSSYSTSPYIPASNSYVINIENELRTASLHNKIMLTFEHYGSERSGIYQLINNEWRYLYSKLSNGKISAKLDVDSYIGGTYAVLIDKDYIELKDVHINWAGKEIYTFIRRKYITGYKDRTFRPESNITRAEFITLLSRVMKWNNNINHSVINKFNDYDTFGMYSDLIAKATSIGLINGYPDNTFKPNNNISYQEVEWIIQRLPLNNDFNWDNIADKMMYEKYTRSDSLKSKENHITRAEVVYMLYNLQNQRKI